MNALQCPMSLSLIRIRLMVQTIRSSYDYAKSFNNKHLILIPGQRQFQSTAINRLLKRTASSGFEFTSHVGIEEKIGGEENGGFKPMEMKEISNTGE